MIVRLKIYNQEVKMRKYINPQLEVVELEKTDIITTSLGTETTPKDENDGIWDVDLV